MTGIRDLTEPEPRPFSGEPWFSRRFVSLDLETTAPDHEDAVLTRDEREGSTMNYSRVQAVLATAVANGALVMGAALVTYTLTGFRLAMVSTLVIAALMVAAALLLVVIIVVCNGAMRRPMLTVAIPEGYDVHETDALVRDTYVKFYSWRWLAHLHARQVTALLAIPTVRCEVHRVDDAFISKLVLACKDCAIGRKRGWAVVLMQNQMRRREGA